MQIKFIFQRIMLLDHKFKFKKKNIKNIKNIKNKDKGQKNKGMISKKIKQ